MGGATLRSLRVRLAGCWSRRWTPMRHDSQMPRSYCRRHRPSMPLPAPGSDPTMFLPLDLTTSEQNLVASVTRQMLEHRRPVGTDEERLVRHEATQIAAEMIFEARAAQHSQVPGETVDDDGA